MSQKHKKRRWAIFPHYLHSKITISIYLYLSIYSSPVSAESDKFEKGEVTFGAIPAKYTSKEFTYVPLFMQCQWTIYFTKIQYGSQIISERLPADIDTGSGLTFGPSAAVRKIFPQLSRPSVEYGRVHIDCEHLHTYPDLVITLQNKEFRIPTQNLVIYEMHKKKRRCLFGIRYYVDDPGTRWCFGLTVLRNFLTVFNKTQNSIAFSDAVC
ncbi:plasmepsin-2 [Clonorchis sinensis]|uniref:Plasmepsin-2 n=1 Tax=Clonorchis sinensis TaxID=79923 RepID=A0A3R7JQ85_CLOSI|nr:plasmepsin-2 [Clonorchis sinensis]